MTKDQRLKLERLFNLVQPGHLRVDVRTNHGWTPIAIFEDRGGGVDVQLGTIYPNNSKLNPMHPDNDKEYHFANLVVAAVNSLPELLHSLMEKE